VESIAIVGEIGRAQTLNHNTWLVCIGGKLVNFDLRLRVKLTRLPAANSLIQFRCQVDSVHHVSGYQADLDVGAVWLGRIYDERGRASLVERETRFRLAANGGRTEQRYAAAEQFPVGSGRLNDCQQLVQFKIDLHCAFLCNTDAKQQLARGQEGGLHQTTRRRSRIGVNGVTRLKFTVRLIATCRRMP